MRSCGIVALGVHLPGTVVGLDDLYENGDGPPPRGPLLRPPDRRRHVGAEVRASEMIAAAAAPLFERLGGTPRIDAVLCNVLLPDIPITGAGAEVCSLLDLSPQTVLDVHNGGCGSFPFMLDLAARLLEGEGGMALVCNVQNTAGRVFSQPTVRLRSHAVAAGDGCGVALLDLEAGSRVLATAVAHQPDSAADMGLEVPDGRLYWEAGEGEVDIHFAREKAERIIRRGNEAVPAAVRAACERAGVAVEELDALVTNQPNRLFMRNWREELGIPAERHLDTFDELGNLYGAAAPVTLARAAATGRLRDGDLVAVAGFAHAGDFAAAAVIRWDGETAAAKSDPGRGEAWEAVAA
ncbi:MAG TPA: 3-oxoacyl-[acyl-carrier-protein] synthase III C-terminal domain-containing protein [Solirubrobacterales bacterium]